MRPQPGQSQALLPVLLLDGRKVPEVAKIAKIKRKVSHKSGGYERDCQELMRKRFGFFNLQKQQGSKQDTVQASGRGQSTGNSSADKLLAAKKINTGEREK